MLIGFVALIGMGEKVSKILYFVIGFAFFVAATGFVITFLELRTSGKSTESLDVSSEIPDFEHTVRQLSRNYDILRKQATQGFVMAGTFMTLGICVILAGSVGELFGFTKVGSNLTIIAGVVVEAISGLGLYLFRQTFKQLNATSDRLHESWKILMAFKKAEELPDGDKRCELIASLITKLVEGGERKMDNSVGS